MIDALSFVLGALAASALLSLSYICGRVLRDVVAFRRARALVPAERRGVAL